MSTRSYNPLFMLGDNKAACAYHLGHMLDEPEYYRDVVYQLFNLYDSGKIKPIVDTVWTFEDVCRITLSL